MSDEMGRGTAGPVTESERGSALRTTDTSYGELYWQTLDGGLGYADSVMWEDIAHTIKELFCIRPGRDASADYCLIDVGCAMGYLVKHLRRRGVEAFGLDFSSYALEHADEMAKPHLTCFDLTHESLPEFPVKFNLLTCFETLEHIPAEHAWRAVKHLWNLLEPNGFAILTVCVEGQPGWDTDPTHQNVVSRDYWDQLFRERGFYSRSSKAQRLRQFWLFSQHRGVWVLQKQQPKLP